jgi:acyl carrier protein
VDVVLNSLSGDFIPRSLEVLGSGGRFVEIGKRAIWEASRVRDFRCDVTYLPFDLLEQSTNEPALIARMLEELTRCVERGEFTPLPLKVFALRDAGDAFREMARARHTGKLVVAVRESVAGVQGPPNPVETTQSIRPKASPMSRREDVLAYVRDQAANVLGHESSQHLDLGLRMFDLGFDSLLAMELRNRIESRLKVTIPEDLLLEDPSLVELVAGIVDQIPPEVFAAAPVGQLCNPVAAGFGPPDGEHHIG